AAAGGRGGRLGQAEPTLAEVAAGRPAAGQVFLAMLVCYDLGQVQRAQGCLGAALRTYRQALETAREAGQRLPLAGMAHVGLAEVLYERGELDAAHENAAEGVALGRRRAPAPQLATDS